MAGLEGEAREATVVVVVGRVVVEVPVEVPDPEMMPATFLLALQVREKERCVGRLSLIVMIPIR